MEEKKRCAWCNIKNPLYVSYHDNEWGRFPPDERSLYELFILETFQSGLSWECILNKRENFRRAYDNYDIEKVSAYDEKKIEELMKDSSIIRNNAKIKASINNSRVYKDIQIEFGTFASYLKSFINEITFIPDTRVKSNSLSDAISEDLRKRGMKYTGSITIYSFLQAIGLVLSHQRECYLYRERF